MALCTALSSSTFDVLICLGLPWFIKATWFHKADSSRSVDIHSKSLDDSAIAVMISTIGFMVLMCAKKFVLTKTVRTQIVRILRFIIIFRFFFPYPGRRISRFRVVIDLFGYGLQRVHDEMSTIILFACNHR